MELSERIVKLRNKIEKLKSQRDQQQGELDGVLRILQQEHQCESVEVAQARLEQLQTDEHQLTAELDEKIQAFGEHYEIS